MEEEEEVIDRQINDAEKEKERIELDEERFWREYNKYSRDLFILEDDYRR